MHRLWLLVLLSFALNARSQSDLIWKVEDRAAWINWRVVAFPWRVVEGRTNFVPRTSGWVFTSRMKILQVTSAGVLVEMDYKSAGTNWTSTETVMVKNYPYSVVDGQVESYDALKRVGTYQFTTVLGATRTVSLYDFGIPIPAPEVSRAPDRKATNASSKKVVKR